MGTTRAARWERGNPIPLLRNTASWSTLSTRTPTILMGSDVDQLWIRGANVPGYHEVYRADIGERPGVIESGEAIFTRQDFTGTWVGPTSFPTNGPVGAGLRSPARISLAGVNQALELCVVEVGGRLLHVSRTPGGAPEFNPRFDVEFGRSDVTGAGEIGTVIDAGCAGVLNPATSQEELHVCAVTDDGRLWHAVGSAFGAGGRPGVFTAWTRFGDVESQIGDLGEFIRVDCAPNLSQLHLVGVARRGGGYAAWHTIRGTSSWTAPTDVLAAASPFSVIGQITDVAIGFCNEGVPPDGPRDVSHLNVAIALDGRLLHTIRSAQAVRWTPTEPPSHWSPLTDLSQAAGGSALTFRNVSVSERPFAP